MNVDREFLDTVFGDVVGVAHFAIGRDPHQTGKGTYGFSNFEQISVEWPASAKGGLARLDAATAGSKCDLFFCPNLLETNKRAKNTAVVHRLLHADADNGVPAEKLAPLCAFTVASGRPGHLHVYVRLDRDVTRDEYRRLQRGMRAYFDGDNKIADNDLLRPVGSVNHKAIVLGGLDRPYEVVWGIKPTGHAVAPAYAARILGLSTKQHDAKDTRTGTHEPTAPITEPVDLSLHGAIRHVLDNRTDDRSSDSYRIIGVCYRSGLTIAQTRWVVDQREDLTERLAERKDDDVLRIFLKFVEDEQRLKSSTANPESANADPKFVIDVGKELRKMQVREEARRRYAALQNSSAAKPDVARLREILERPAEPTYRIDQLLPSDGAMVVVAQRKTGKTTLVLNLALSLITGVFSVAASRGNVALMNYEVSARQMAVWAAQVGIPDERLVLVNLRGVRNPLLDDEGAQELAGRLAGLDIDVLIVDPFAQAYGGSSQNDAAEVNRFLARLNDFARSGLGVKEIILTAHAGWKAERSRGSSALEDWPDSIVTMTREEKDSTRYIRAEGRDVDVAEDQLMYEPQRRQLTMSGRGGRRDVSFGLKVDGLMPPLLKAISECGTDGTQAVIKGPENAEHRTQLPRS